MTAENGAGWGDVTYTITTNGTARFTGTLADGSWGVRYFCIEDNIHTIELNGTSHEDEDLCFQFGEWGRWWSVTSPSLRIGRPP